MPYRPDPDCPLCHGAGFLYPRDQQGQVVYNKAIPCRCLGKSVKDRVPAEVARQTFETFKPVKGTEKALKAARDLAYGSAKFVWLLIYGPPGNGKTHLCNAIVKVTRERSLRVRMVLAADLFSQLREAIRTNMTDEMLRGYKQVDFLAIDDYGVEYNSDWERAKFDELMTSRFAVARPTVLITNKDISDLPDRIRSRFEDTVMARAIANKAPDYRSTRK